ncbi:Photosystem II protein D1 [Capsicum chinense]|nr:Photosystem II protein D1 [Capsicum chinense]
MIVRPSLPRLDGYLKKRGKEGKDPMNSKELKECNWELAWCSYWLSFHAYSLSIYAEHNILMHPFHILGLAGVKGGSLFSAMHAYLAPDPAAASQLGASNYSGVAGLSVSEGLLVEAPTTLARIAVSHLSLSD